jgi:hypothetical protein
MAVMRRDPFFSFLLSFSTFKKFLYIYNISFARSLKYMELGPAIAGPCVLSLAPGTTNNRTELWVATGGTARYYNMQMNLPRRFHPNGKRKKWKKEKKKLLFFSFFHGIYTLAVSIALWAVCYSFFFSSSSFSSVNPRVVLI